jgi:hypothetical protein
LFLLSNHHPRSIFGVRKNFDFTIAGFRFKAIFVMGGKKREMVGGGGLSFFPLFPSS